MRSLDNGDSALALDYAEHLERQRDAAREAAALVPELVAALRGLVMRADHGTIPPRATQWDVAKDALAAYDAAAQGQPPVPDPLAVAVKCMEAVPTEEIIRAFWDGSPAMLIEQGVEAIRARLIKAAKGEEP